MKNAYLILSLFISAAPFMAMAADENQAPAASRQDSASANKNNSDDNIATGTEAIAADRVNDPLESVNRVFFSFNTYADRYVLRPAAVGYKYVVPQWGRQRVTNFFYNLSEPVTLVNSVLQGDPENSFSSTWRFLINSTAGVGGLFDAATAIGLKEHPEDFGQTLGHWGYRNPPYIVLPILGPSTVRDGVGAIVDFYANPFYDGIVIDDEGVIIGMGVVNGVDKRTNLLPLTDDIEKTSLDPYVTYRSYYLQNRENKINNGDNVSNTMTNY